MLQGRCIPQESANLYNVASIVNLMTPDCTHFRLCTTNKLMNYKGDCSYGLCTGISFQNESFSKTSD